MELGGFVRYTSLDRQQRGHMFTQKHANLVIWNLRNRAETTDPQTSDPMHDGEKTEEKLPTHDAVVEPDSYASPGRAEALLENIRRDQNVALANELGWMFRKYKQQFQSGLSVRVVRTIRNVFQRLFWTHRYRGSDERMESFRPC